MFPMNKFFVDNHYFNWFIVIFHDISTIFVTYNHHLAPDFYILAFWPADLWILGVDGGWEGDYRG